MITTRDLKRDYIRFHRRTVERHLYEHRSACGRPKKRVEGATRQS